ncbi:uncharacterized protein MONOS_14033 [Monocercomonoides exilis]|uniref:uncharacterized protein n=1 Tax=Monocercomonoides exilis TaxID=2049356 RepID=UPI00355A8752|nr:hypothetical protein MONOS_14033 [Monocercomonoides exilis]|eukprot:MONOS_14033.1-p1 / transcript=MONOS_14033.1 / gene=MONOS_14033 / organism=Monocercomonoides_exilis_PA203 / gene_product=hypothetical protein / transcript_product=hypothetical protein / location=Mono_scaffold00925:16633-17264(+) / protein_length=171 / sequence_SO=supercontig / SO=protein_coding / is_pseudo=false
MSLSLKMLWEHAVMWLAVRFVDILNIRNEKLSAMLFVPLVAPLQSLAMSVGKKLGRKRILSVADMNELLSINDQFFPFAEDMAIAVVEKLSKTDGKYEGHVVKLGMEKEGLGRQIRELKEQHEEVKQEMEKLYSEFHMLLQKIRDDERISKRTSGLSEQLQEKYKIIRML